MSDFSSSLTIPDHFRRQFSSVWNSVLQQKDARFAKAGLTVSDWTAKEYVWRDLDKVEAVETTNQRFGDSNPSDISGGARKGYQRQFDTGIKRDRWDQKFLAMSALPDSQVITEMKQGLNRAIDDVFIQAAYADSLGGADPYNTTIALPNSSKVPVNYVLGGTGANIGITPEKIMETMVRFEESEVDTEQEELYLALHPRDLIYLAQYIKTVNQSSSNAFWAEAVGDWLKDHKKGLPSKLLGFNVIVSTRLPLDTTTDIRTNVAFAKSAMVVSPLVTDLHVDVIPEKRHMLQIMDYISFGAVRVNDKKVQLIYSDLSP